MKLIKTKGIQIVSDNPFANDVLNREPIVKNLTELIKNTDDPLVLSISAPWGYGKTTFIKMWQQYLTNNDFSTIYYNAWENDFLLNPLASLIGEIEYHVNEKLIQIDKNEKLRNSLGSIKETGKKLLRASTPLALKILSQGTINNADEFMDIFSNVNKKDNFEEYTNHKNNLINFKTNLSNLATVLGENGKNLPIVFFVDEIDRCHPAYVIDLLEAIKHIFSIENYVFILAVDRKHLSEMVKTRFGKGMESNGYLRRFIDLDFSLPIPSNEKYAKHLWNVFNLESIANATPYEENRQFFYSTFTIFSNFYKLSYRVQSQCVSQIEIFSTIRSRVLTAQEFIISIFLILSNASKQTSSSEFLPNSEERIEVLNMLLSDKELLSFVKSNADKTVIAVILISLEYLQGLDRDKILSKYHQGEMSTLHKGSKKYKILEKIPVIIGDINYYKMVSDIEETMLLMKDFTL